MRVEGVEGAPDASRADRLGGAEVLREHADAQLFELPSDVGERIVGGATTAAATHLVVVPFEGRQLSEAAQILRHVEAVQPVLDGAR